MLCQNLTGFLLPFFNNALNFVVNRLSYLRTVATILAHAAANHLATRTLECDWPEVAHTVLRYHITGEVCHDLQVVTWAGGKVAKDHLLGDVPAECHGDVVNKFFFSVHLAVFVGQLEGVPRRAAARNNRNLLYWVGKR